jgi:hypothetical protein
MVKAGELMTIGELSRQTGLRPSALRFYEELGLLHPRPHGSPAGAATIPAPCSCSSSWRTAGDRLRASRAHRPGRRSATARDR